MSRGRGSFWLRLGVVLCTGVLGLGVTGCVTAPKTEDAATTTVVGGGTVTEFAADQRADPISIIGNSVSGEPVDITQWRGNVVVVNLWYAACGPCRAEAADLVQIATDSKADGVQFVGLNTRDNADTAAAFERSFNVPYPTVLDPEGTIVAGLSGQVTPQAVPTTLVLDRQGRVAARILGAIDAATVRTLIKEALKEPSAAG